MSDPKASFRMSVLLSAQRALVGEVTSRMRQIGVEFSPAYIRFIIWYDGPIGEDEKNNFDAGVISQVVADFPDPEHGDPLVGLKFIRCDAPTKIDYQGFDGDLVYGRSEPFEAS
ncbi:hypothetical protein C1752_01738 [Acaryochloris thomasi RCC1774]|uniref:Uncharacterized protein n=1 Tax=Acaryochloris thomasi RCC1774 TaxID=1764569 RepID=A0A2W1JWE7_9CYAN|nr:hypothetical protein [Acaryochloris thomasi]PZD74004.1 hypothetical protein C1752_01738 [Acaryochloris thomasi RCC1774]